MKVWGLKVWIGVGVVAAFVIGTECFVWFWYDFRNVGAGQVVGGTMEFASPRSSERERWEEQDLKETRLAKILAFDEGRLISGEDLRPGGWLANVNYLVYRAGNERQLKDLFDHSPEVCLPASGAKFVREEVTRDFPIGGRSYPVRHLLFRHPQSGNLLHVFKFVWLEFFEGMDERADVMQQLVRAQVVDREKPDFRKVRLRAALAGYRPREARLLLVVLEDEVSAESAWAWFRERILSRLRESR